MHVCFFAGLDHAELGIDRGEFGDQPIRVWGWAVLRQVPGRPPIPVDRIVVGWRGSRGALAGCWFVIIEVPSMPAAAGLVKACVIEAAAPYGQPVVLWHWKGSLGDATQKQKSAGRMAGV
jgi:hypothetical protein